MNTPPPKDTGARKLVALDWVLLLLALAIPFAAADRHHSATGYFMILLGVLMMGALALSAIVSWAVHGSSARSDGRRRMIVGGALAVLALLASALRLPSAIEEEAASTEEQELLARHAEEGAAIAARINAMDLSTVLSPEGIATARGRAVGRAKLDSSRALIAERQTLLKAKTQEWRTFLSTHGAAMPDRYAAERSLETGFARSESLSVAQLGVLSAIGNVLDWAATQSGAVSAVDGHLVIAAERQRIQYRRLIDSVRAAEERQMALLQVNGTAAPGADSAILEHLFR